MDEDDKAPGRNPLAPLRTSCPLLSSLV
uniref:Uncharacterized protein n=1 Tax=Arundo donax TaxID=35708 RepID=A0A0A8ZSK6_ARUDO